MNIEMRDLAGANIKMKGLTVPVSFWYSD